MNPRSTVQATSKRVVVHKQGLRRWLRRMKRPLHIAGALIKALVLVGCNLVPMTPSQPDAAPTAAVTPPPSAAPGWDAVMLGVERRMMIPDGLSPLSQVIVYRLDPQHITFKAHVAGQPLRVTEWRGALPNALGFVNANFFAPDNTPQGLVVSDGSASGQSYINRGGMFQVAGGIPRVRSLIAEPYQGEALEQAVQAFPMLVLDRQPILQDPRADRTSRRTVVAQDSAGRIILLVTPLLGMTLNEMAAFLSTDPDLDVVHALNLDGGGSTMLSAPVAVEMPSFDPVPVVLAFYAR